MDPQTLVFVLFFAGLLLIFAELFVPSGGAIGVLCLCCFLASGYFAYQAWFVSHRVFWYVYLGSVAVLIPTAVIGAFQLLTRTSLGNRILLTAPSLEEVTPYQRESEHLTSLIGKQGVALNLMTPGGLINVNGERLHAISDDLMIEANSPVEVVAVRGIRVVVRPVRTTSEPDQLTKLAEEAEHAAEEEDPWRMPGDEASKS